jgi:hypothetical protein
LRLTELRIARLKAGDEPTTDQRIVASVDERRPGRRRAAGGAAETTERKRDLQRPRSERSEKG